MGLGDYMNTFFYLSWIIKLQIQVTVTRKTVKTSVNDERRI